MNGITMKMDHERCVLCLDCVEACPNGVLDCDDTSGKITLVRQSECIVCRQCEDVCDVGAITFEGAYSQKDILVD